MEFEKCQAIDYALSLFPSYLKYSELPLYKIVWSINDELISAKTYQTKDGRPIKNIVKNGIDIFPKSLTTEDNNFLVQLRAIWYEKYGNSFDNPLALYKTPEVLLPELIKLVTPLTFKSDTKSFELFDVTFINKKSTFLPFMILNSNQSICPVSLVSKN